jgi:hypothetical protein
MQDLSAIRRERGDRAIRLHPDLPGEPEFYATAASDIIADILHAVYGGEEAFRGEPTELLDRALRTYEGDAEDDEPVLRGGLYSREDA